MCYNARKKGGKAGGISPKFQQTPSMSPIRGESEESESGREGSGGKGRKRAIGHLPQHYQVAFHGLKIPREKRGEGNSRVVQHALQHYPVEFANRFPGHPRELGKQNNTGTPELFDSRDFRLECQDPSSNFRAP